MRKSACILIRHIVSAIVAVLLVAIGLAALDSIQNWIRGVAMTPFF